LSAVQEAMNQMMGAAATSMSTVFDKRVDISLPSIELKKSDEEIETEELTLKQSIVKVSFELKIGTLIYSCIMQLMIIDYAKEFVVRLLNGSDEETATSEETVKNNIDNQEQMGQLHTQEEKAIQSEEASQESNTGPQFIGSATNQQNAQVEQADFSNFKPIS